VRPCTRRRSRALSAKRSSHHADKISDNGVRRPPFPGQADGKIQGAVGDLAKDEAGRAAFAVRAGNQGDPKTGGGHNQQCGDIERSRDKLDRNLLLFEIWQDAGVKIVRLIRQRYDRLMTQIPKPQSAFLGQWQAFRESRNQRAAIQFNRSRSAWPAGVSSTCRRVRTRSLVPSWSSKVLMLLLRGGWEMFNNAEACRK
jgi:hypothetical protein